MINYILQVILFQVLFLVIYDLLLSKETFFITNRWYLLGTSIVSFLLPFIKVPTFQQAAPQEFLIVLPEIVLSPQKVLVSSVEPAQLESSINYLSILFWVGIVVFAIIFLLKLFTILKLIFNNEKEKRYDITLVLLSKTTKAFSFFNYVFLGKLLKPEQREKVIAHELVHSKQKHTLDLLYFEFLKIVMWFNPMIYVYQKRITLVHEYITDNCVAAQETKESYVDGLLASTFQVEKINFVNQFYQESLLKKRIRMIMKTKSKKMNQLKYLLLIPVLGSMLFYVSCSEESSGEVFLVNKLQNTKEYSPAGDGIKTRTFESKSYMDFYYSFNDEPLGVEIKESDLSSEALNELREQRAKRIDNEKMNPEGKFYFRLYKYNDRPVIGIHKRKSAIKESRQIINNEIVDDTSEADFNFIDVNIAPTFEGCEKGDKNCFAKNVQKYFALNFDPKLPNELGLESGRKRVFISFIVNKLGQVEDVKVRAPHEKIQEEVVKIIESLPKMMPAEHENKPVSVKFSIPFVIVVD